MVQRSLLGTASALATAFMISGTATALAADLPPPPPPPVEIRDSVFDWSGIYVGINTGIGFADGNYVPTATADPDLAGDGWMIGGVVGYNYQMNNFVMGIEGDINYGEINPTNLADNVFQDIDFFATLRARLGYAHGNTMAYVTGGMAWADSEVTADVILAADSDSKTHFGWVVGGGLEHAWTDNLTGRIEYLFADLGSETYSYPPSFCGQPACEIDLDLDDFHVVRFGGAWKF
jgi:outer membrane immunogenic protein